MIQQIENDGGKITTLTLISSVAGPLDNPTAEKYQEDAREITYQLGLSGKKQLRTAPNQVLSNEQLAALKLDLLYDRMLVSIPRLKSIKHQLQVERGKATQSDRRECQIRMTIKRKK